MTARPVPLTDAARTALQPALERGGQHDWAEIEHWIAIGGACVWQCGEGYVLTRANTDDEIEAVFGGGVRAAEWASEIEAAVRAHPAHRGMTLRFEGRKGWKRLFPHWTAIDLPNGLVLFTSEVADEQ